MFRVLGKEFASEQLAAWCARHNVGERAAAIDPELPAIQAQGYALRCENSMLIVRFRRASFSGCPLALSFIERLLPMSLQAAALKQQISLDRNKPRRCIDERPRGELRHPIHLDREPVPLAQSLHQ